MIAAPSVATACSKPHGCTVGTTQPTAISPTALPMSLASRSASKAETKKQHNALEQQLQAQERQLGLTAGNLRAANGELAKAKAVIEQQKGKIGELEKRKDVANEGIIALESEQQAKIKAMVEATGNEVEAYWPMIAAKFFTSGDNCKNLIVKPGGSGGGGGGGGGGGDAGGDAEKEEEKKEEEEEEEVDMAGGMDMFGGEGGGDDY